MNLNHLIGKTFEVINKGQGYWNFKEVALKVKPNNLMWVDGDTLNNGDKVKIELITNHPSSKLEPILGVSKGGQFYLMGLEGLKV